MNSSFNRLVLSFSLFFLPSKAAPRVFPADGGAEWVSTARTARAASTHSTTTFMVLRISTRVSSFCLSSVQTPTSPFFYIHPPRGVVSPRGALIGLCAPPTAWCNTRAASFFAPYSRPLLPSSAVSVPRERRGSRGGRCAASQRVPFAPRGVQLF